ncbi:hypothetical protein [Micromonospora inaquosa]|uniref:hypothetical protein n=1 Tax=Micromonospora inaquosa TaxID=2203716 RepID=UPI001FCA3E58|nr:hypothetical protein [Micromonospora inaquosa]
MAWSFGHSLIVVLALLLGLAAGWLLRGRRGVQGNSIVDGDPVAGLAVIATPTPDATTDEAHPAAAVDSAPIAVADEPAPVDTVSAPAAMTESDGPTPVPAPADTPSAAEAADMALTEDPPPAPATEQPDAAELRPEPVVESAPEPVTADEQSAPAAVVAPRQPADDLPPADPAPVDTTPVDTTPVDDAPVSVGPADDAETERSAVATPPVRPTTTATPPVRSAADAAISLDADPTGPADDFRRIQGIGPKMAAALQDAGVRTYGQLGELDEPALRDLIRAAGLRAAPGLASWPQQARVLAGAGDEMAAVLPNGNQA